MKETVQQTKQRYALYGAQYRIDALQQEINAIRKAFPTLPAGQVAGAYASEVLDAPQPQKRVRTWSKAQRAEASKRAKAFWAKRRKEK